MNTTYTHARSRSSLADQAFEFLSAAIVSGRYAPGQTLPVAEVALAVGSSRSPVREALVRLQYAGLIDTAPARYTRVMNFDDGNAAATLQYTGDVFGAALRDAHDDLDAPDREHLATLIVAVAATDAPDTRAGAVGRFLDALIGGMSPPLRRRHAVDARLLTECTIRFGRLRPLPVTELARRCDVLAQLVRTAEKGRSVSATHAVFAALASAER